MSGNHINNCAKKELIAAIGDALKNAGIHIIEGPNSTPLQGIDAKYLLMFPEIKQHEQYGWYRKFDTKKRY